MGSQINFFLGPNDLADLFDVLTQSNDIVILSDESDSELPQEAPRVVPIYGVDRLRVLIARRTEMASLRLKPVGKTGRYTARTQDANLVEFDRPYVSQGYIRAGRLYRTDSIWQSDGSAYSKGEEWKKWASKLFSRCRKSLEKVGDTGFYAGKEALGMRKAGVLFQQVEDPKGLRCLE